MLEGKSTLKTSPSLKQRLWSLALPMMLANSSIALFGLVDAAVVGHLDNETYLAGVALASVLFDFLYWGVTFLRMGTTGVTAQAFGGQDIQACRDSFFESAAIALALGGIMLVFHGPLMGFGFELLNASPAATSKAEIYFQIKIWGAPAVLLSMVLMGWLIGVQEANLVLKLTAMTSVVNIVLDVLFVFGFDLGIEGVAFASVLASYFSACLGLSLCARVFRSHGVAFKFVSLKAQRLRRLLSLNLNIFIRTLCLITAFALFTRSGAQQGDVLLAANTVLLSFQMLLALALDGYANALEVLVGEAIGEKDRAKLNKVIAVGTLWSVLSALVFSLAYLVLGHYLISLLTDIVDVREAAGEYLVWLVASPLIAVWCFVFDGVFIGATQGRAMRDSMLFALVAIYLPALWLLNGYANHGVWAAFMLFFAARGVSMIWLFYRIKGNDGFVGAA